ncbi:MAG: hypothetical protein ACXABY_35865 [Candidatus Thorarchaeota archaeon]|jgi:hypothetical protein
MKKLLIAVLILLMPTLAWAVGTKTIDELTELERPALTDQVAIDDQSAGSMKKIELGTVTPLTYFLDPDEVDICATGSGRSLKDIIDYAGAENATVVLANHDSTTTTYTCSTAETVPITVYLSFQAGAQVSIGSGVTLTVYSPANIIASPGQTLFSGLGSVAFTDGTSADKIIIWDHSESKFSTTTSSESGYTALDDVGDPDAVKTFVMAANTLTFGSVTDQWGGLTISNSNAAITGETKFLTIDSSGVSNDANLTYLDIQDSGGQIFYFKGGPTRASMGGDFDLVISAMDLGDNDITSLDKLEFFDAAVYIDGGADGVIEIEADTGVDFGTAGVRLLDDGDGAIPFSSAGNDESLTLNFDDYANEIYFTTSSGVLSLNMPGISVKAPMEVTAADADGETLATADLNTVLPILVMLPQATGSPLSLMLPMLQASKVLTQVTNSIYRTVQA